MGPNLFLNPDSFQARSKEMASAYWIVKSLLQTKTNISSYETGHKLEAWPVLSPFPVGRGGGVAESLLARSKSSGLLNDPRFVSWAAMVSSWLCKKRFRDLKKMD